MAKVPIALRLQPEKLERVDAYARERGSSRQVVLEAAVDSFLADAQGGVPELPPEPALKVPAKVVRASRLSPPSDEALARQARVNRLRGS